MAVAAPAGRLPTQDRAAPSDRNRKREEGPSRPVRAPLVRRREFRRGSRGAFRAPWTFILAVLISAEIVIWSGIATNWFGYAPPRATASGPAPPNLNPYDENITSIIAGVTYHGNSTGYFPALEGRDICNHCPAPPFIDYGFSPAVLGFWFEFNVTNDAIWWESIANFTLASSGPAPGPFTPGIAKCCYPSFESEASYAYLEPGQTVGLEILVVAPSLANVGPAGYTLYFNVTAP